MLHIRYGGETIEIEVDVRGKTPAELYQLAAERLDVSVDEIKKTSTIVRYDNSAVIRPEAVYG